MLNFDFLLEMFDFMKLFFLTLQNLSYLKKFTFCIIWQIYRSISDASTGQYKKNGKRPYNFDNVTKLKNKQLVLLLLNFGQINSLYPTCNSFYKI